MSPRITSRIRIDLVTPPEEWHKSDGRSSILRVRGPKRAWGMRWTGLGTWVLLTVGACANAASHPAAHPAPAGSGCTADEANGFIPKPMAWSSRCIRKTPRSSGGADACSVIDLDEEPARDPRDGPVTAGQMTELAARAKRAFDREDWSRASQLLIRVARLETGDDEGNCQIAEYHYAITRYRLTDYARAMDVFASIADNPNHLKFPETLLWLAKLSQHPEQAARAADALGKYALSPLARFGNSQQKDLLHHLHFLAGRAAYRRGDYARARALLRAVPSGHTHRQLARECLLLIARAETASRE